MSLNHTVWMQFPVGTPSFMEEFTIIIRGKIEGSFPYIINAEDPIEAVGKAIEAFEHDYPTGIIEEAAL
jgi:hypothetical protein